MSEALREFFDKLEAGEFETGEQITDALERIMRTAEDLRSTDVESIAVLKRMVAMGIL